MMNSCPYDLLVFDIDGVLLDVRESFPQVINRAVARTLTERRVPHSRLPYGAEEEKFLKLHGGFNDDWDIALFLCNLAIKKQGITPNLPCYIPTLEEIKQEAKSHYFPTEAWLAENFNSCIDRGEFRSMCDWLYCNREDGAYKTEKNLVGMTVGDFPVPVAIYTGRYGEEYELALETLGWQGLPRDHAVTADDGVSKPNPRGLEILANRFCSKRLAFFGDTGSDRQCMESFGKGDFFAIGNLLKSCPNHFDNIRDALKVALGQ